LFFLRPAHEYLFDELGQRDLPALPVLEGAQRPEPQHIGQMGEGRSLFFHGQREVLDLRDVALSLLGVEALDGGKLLRARVTARERFLQLAQSQFRIDDGHVSIEETIDRTKAMLAFRRGHETVQDPDPIELRVGPKAGTEELGRGDCPIGRAEPHDQPAWLRKREVGQDHGLQLFRYLVGPLG
jgi:hypothetical protein